MTGTEGLPEAAFGAALASIAGIGPRRLRQLLVGRAADEAWRSVLLGCEEDPGGQWRRLAQGTDVGALWRAHSEAGVEVLLLGEDRYPKALDPDSEAPAVLFSLGDVGVVDRHPRVAIVGTRSATRYGLSIAAQLGRDLAAAGTIVLSGMALGIDGAAHEGAVASWSSAPDVSAPPVGVVAGGLDRPYPAAHAGLWKRVARAGALLSESPIGCPTPRWRFPLRNRLLAALAQTVVVVECHHRGGSLHTVHAAEQRGIPVGAVPGSVRSPASSGANDLIADGCFVVRDSTDVMVAVELHRADIRPVHRRRGDSGVVADPRCLPMSPLSSSGTGAGSPEAVDRASVTATPRELNPNVDGSRLVDRSVLEAIGWEPCSMEDVLRRTTLSLGTASRALERLRREGRVRESAGWWERC